MHKNDKAKLVVLRALLASEFSSVPSKFICKEVFLRKVLPTDIERCGISHIEQQYLPGNNSNDDRYYCSLDSSNRWAGGSLLEAVIDEISSINANDIPKLTPVLTGECLSTPSKVYAGESLLTSAILADLAPYISKPAMCRAAMISSEFPYASEGSSARSTVLHFVARHGKLNAIPTLDELETNDWLIRDNVGSSPLHEMSQLSSLGGPFTAGEYRLDLLKQLVETGKVPAKALLLKNDEGSTPIDYICKAVEELFSSVRQRDSDFLAKANPEAKDTLVWLSGLGWSDAEVRQLPALVADLTKEREVIDYRTPDTDSIDLDL